jgi:hypothetical protein
LRNFQLRNHEYRQNISTRLHESFGGCAIYSLLHILDVQIEDHRLQPADVDNLVVAPLEAHAGIQANQGEDLGPDIEAATAQLTKRQYEAFFNIDGRDLTL